MTRQQAIQIVEKEWLALGLKLEDFRRAVADPQSYMSAVVARKQRSKK